MKVLHLAAGNLFGGVETLLATFARLRHLCPEMEPAFGLCFPGRLRDELTATGVPVHDLGAVRVSRPWTVLRARSRLQSVLRQHNYDAVVTHGMWPHAVFAPVVRKAKVRLANVVHDYLTRGHWINRWAARTPPDVVIANSQFTATAATSIFPRVRVAVVYPPLSAPEPSDRLATRQRVRSLFRTAAEAIVILIVSRLQELKGHAVLLEALGLLRDAPNWVCWVVGGVQRQCEVELLAQLRERADLLEIADRVLFVGARSDVAAIMKSADVYCQPNTGPEGFGLTFIEAMYAGLPVVTSDFGGATEIITASQGVLCPPRDANAVATALRGILLNPMRWRTTEIASPIRAAELCDPMRQLKAVATNVFEPTNPAG